MTETTDDTVRAAPADQPPIELLAAIVHPDDGPRECTIYPSDVSAEAITTTWLTAEEGSFVSLGRAR